MSHISLREIGWDRFKLSVFVRMSKVKAIYNQDGPDIQFSRDTLDIHHRHPSPQDATTKDIVGVMVCLGFLKQQKITTPDLRLAYARRQIDAAIDEDSHLLASLREQAAKRVEIQTQYAELALEKALLEHEKDKLQLAKAQYKFQRRKQHTMSRCAIL